MKRIPFDPKELIPIGEEPTWFPGAPPRPIYNTPISPKENYLMLMSGDIPMWMPSMSDTTMMTCKLAENVARGFVFEAERIDNNTEAGGPDFFGVEWEYVPTVGGSMVRAGDPKIPDIEHWEDYITFPKVSELMDWEACAKRNIDGGFVKPNKVLDITILTGLFERLISFMDFENAAFALVDEDQQEGVHRLFDRLADFYDEYIDYYHRYLHPDMITFHDDWGSQRAPFFSLNTVREMILPYLKRVAESVHKRGMKIELHSCGKNEMLVPAMIEADIDTWSGQPMNDFEMLYEKYGDKIVLGMPISGLRPDMEDSELRDTIQAFAEKHPHAIGSTMSAPPKATGYLYEISRKVYCGE